MIFAGVIIVIIIYAAGYSAGKQSIRDQLDKIINRKGRK
jgi:hypothetical protein